jgi:hypothetical protein
MFLRYNYSLKFLFIIVVVANINCNAQNSSFEFWPETDIWYRLNSSWRLSSFVAITKYNESQSRDINVSLQADYAWGHTKSPIYRRLVDEEKVQIVKVWMVRSGFMKGSNLPNNTNNYAEDMLVAEIHRREPLKSNILLSQRFRMDNRWLGSENDFSYRFRYRIMVEKEYKSKNNSIVPYVSIEPYWDSRYSQLVRTRAIAGVTNTLGEHLAIEGNITYQYDKNYSTENLYALNVVFHVFLEKSKKFK